MSGKKCKNKSSFLGKVLYVSGTIALVFMLSFSAVNFISDARVLKAPVLSKETAPDKEVKGTEADDYKTIKYKKPTPTPKPKAKKTPAPKTATPTPTPKAIPPSDP